MARNPCRREDLGRQLSGRDRTQRQPPGMELGSLSDRGRNDRYLWALLIERSLSTQEAVLQGHQRPAAEPRAAGSRPHARRRPLVERAPSAAEYSYFVHLEVPAETAHDTDNYFDMEPDTEHTVVVERSRKPR